MDVLGLNVERWGHNTFLLEGEKSVCIDPFKTPARPKKVDLVLVSHEHFDHCAPEKVREVASERTAVAGHAGSAQKLRGIGAGFTPLQPGESATLQGVRVETLKAYNLNKWRSPGVPFHPPGSNHLGFVLHLKGLRVYYAGDTDFTDEMKALRGVDIALLPVSGTYVMTADEAAEAARHLKPRVAVPMHYGEIVGTAADAERFRDLL
ncbi:MAG: MBL fold metallo-hydrolase, partial [Nitrospinota bacterium]